MKIIVEMIEKKDAIVSGDIGIVVGRSKMNKIITKRSKIPNVED